MSELTVPAKRNELDKVIALVDAFLDGMEATEKNRLTLEMVVEELFINITQYAYDEDDGVATILIEKHKEDSVRIIFKDSGKEYNPLKKEDPDITLSAEARDIGGLGIYMVKKSVDDITYARKNGQNVLTITKKVKRS